MGYQVIEPNPEIKNYHKISISASDALKRAREGKYESFAETSGMWNRYIRPCTLKDLEGLVSWMATGDVYESNDGKTLYIHGFSINDMY